MTLEDILFIVRTTGRQDVADAIIAMAKQLDALKVNSAAATDAAPSPPHGGSRGHRPGCASCLVSRPTRSAMSFTLATSACRCVS